MYVSGAVGQWAQIGALYSPCMLPVLVIPCAHRQLPRWVDSNTESELKKKDVLVVEWVGKGEESDPVYARFVEGLGVPLHKIQVSIPDIGRVVDDTVMRNDFRELNKYEQLKAGHIYDYICEHRHQSIGLITGTLPWKFAKSLFDQNGIPYSLPW